MFNRFVFYFISFFIYICGIYAASAQTVSATPETAGTSQSVQQNGKNVSEKLLNIFEMPDKNDPYYDQKVKIHSEDAFLHELLKNGKDDLSVEMLNDALAGYKNKRASGVPDGTAFQEYLTERSNVCPECIREIVGREYTESPVTAADSEDCRIILESNKFADRQDKIVFKDGKGSVFEFTTFYSGWENLPETEMKVRQEKAPVQSAVAKPVYFPKWQMERIGYFELNGKLYASDSDPDAKKFSIFEFVPEHRFFKDVCTLSSNSVKLETVFGQEEPVCQKIVKKEYTPFSFVPLNTVMGNDYTKFHQQMCNVSAELGGETEGQTCAPGKEYILAKNSKGGVMGGRIDYNNDQNSEYIVQTSYESPQCRYSYLRVYDPDVRDTKLITTGKVGDVYPENNGTGDYSVPCAGGTQSIVLIDGIYYLLTSNADGPERLDEVFMNQDGSNSIDHYCSFSLRRIYQ